MTNHINTTVILKFDRRTSANFKFLSFLFLSTTAAQIPKKDSIKINSKATNTPTMILVVLSLLLLPTVPVVVVGVVVILLLSAVTMVDMAVDDSDSTIVVLLPPVVYVHGSSRCGCCT